MDPLNCSVCLAMSRLKRLLIILAVFISTLSPKVCSADMATDSVKGYVPPAPNEVQISFSGIVIPLSRLILAHGPSGYCAIKFTKFWTEKEGQEKFARYEAYDLGRDTRVPPDSKMETVVDTVSSLPSRGPFYPLKWQPGNPEIKCGRLRFLWQYRGGVCFFGRKDNPGEHGIQLAPTPWTSIGEVNLTDPRIRWYRYDENRKTINVSIDQLW